MLYLKDLADLRGNSFQDYGAGSNSRFYFWNVYRCTTYRYTICELARRTSGGANTLKSRMDRPGSGLPGGIQESHHDVLSSGIKVRGLMPSGSGSQSS
jgi:hypothetical protein